MEIVNVGGKLFLYEPHYGRLDRRKYPAQNGCSIWCVCDNCRAYYKDVREVVIKDPE